MTKQSFAPGLVRAVAEYFIPHRDKKIKLVRFVTDLEGDTMLLVRMTDAQGVKLSTLMSYCRDYGSEDPEYDVREEFTVPREDEQKMLAWHMTADADNMPSSMTGNIF